MSMLLNPGPKSSAAPPPQSAQPVSPTDPIRPHYFVAPRRAISDRINVRMVVFAALVILLIGAPFSIWLREAVNGGIVNHGTYYEVDLKAMSSFDLDQINGLLTDVPQKWRGLDGQHVEFKGDMYAPFNAGGPLDHFQICFSRTKCCFQMPPLVQHFVNCTVVPGVAVYYYDDPVRVSGILRVRIVKDVDKGIMKIKSLYEMKVDDLEPL